MRTRPILFGGEMVRAILSGAKTQTRRPVAFREFGPSSTRGYAWHFRGTRRGHPKSSLWQDLNGEDLLKLCPLGVIGDRLWVRETWFDNVSDWQGNESQAPSRCIYRADGEFCDQFPEEYMGAKWSPSIHMPRWASRILLEIVGVGIQQLQTITEEDAYAEGVTIPSHMEFRSSGNLNDRNEARAAFQELWDSIYRNWDANPWVWSLTFRVLGEVKQ